MLKLAMGWFLQFGQRYDVGRLQLRGLEFWETKLDV
jgi:hypothetical protein